MVKRSRDQSQEAPSRLSCWMMVPPDSAFAAERTASRLLALHELALDHHLGRDAGMVGAGLPEHVAAAHALETGEHILERVVQRMAHMQGAGDVGRRDHDAIGLGVTPILPA